MSMPLPVARLERMLSAPELWSFGFPGLLLWVGTAPGVQAGMGGWALTMWLPCCLLGVAINFQVRRLAAHSPDLAGGTPNLTARLLPDHPWLARYAAFSYYQGWASTPALCALILVPLLAQSLPNGLGQTSQKAVAVTLAALPFVVAFAGTRALSILHMFFLVPALGLLFAFCIAGMYWFGGSLVTMGEIGAEPVSWGLWAQWYFVATYAVYGVETAASFCVDSRDPAQPVRCLKIAAWVMPLVIISGSWVLTQAPYLASGQTYAYLHAAAAPFWGEWAAFLVTFLVAAAVLLASATGCANSPRVIYQLALDRQAAPLFAVVSRGNVPGPALIFTLLIALTYLWVGDPVRILMISGTGYFFAFITLHFALWLNRGKPQVLWPRWALLFCGFEALIFVAGGLAWGWQDFLWGLTVPGVLMALDYWLQGASWKVFQPAWWEASRRWLELKTTFSRDYAMLHVTALLVFFSAAAIMGWMAGLVVDAHPGRPSLFAIILLLVGFIGIAAAGWTILPNIASINQARAETAQLLQNAVDAILIIGPGGIVSAANPAAQRLFPEQALTGRTLSEVLGLDETALTHGADSLTGRTELTIPQANGAITVEATVSAPAAGNVSSRIVILRDISMHKRLQAQLERNALFDSLTQLANRPAFVDRLQRTIARAAGEGEAGFAVMFLDLDGFKAINDEFGHSAGDLLLTEIAQRLEASVRPGDCVARFGGDEFTVLLDRICDANEATSIAERILQALAVPMILGGVALRVAASIGIAIHRKEHESADDMLRDADTAMYRAKLKGKARLEFY